MAFLNISKNENKDLTKSKIVKVTFIKDLDNVDISNVKGGIKEETRKVLIKKAPLGKWHELSLLLEKFFDLFKEFLQEQGVEDTDKFFENLTVKKLIDIFPKFISGIYKFAIDEIIEFISIGTGLDEEFICNNLDMEETFEIIKAIIEVNGLIKVGQEVKNLIKLPKQIQEWMGRNFSEK
ncbi:hypothetical protein [Halocella sp. SP3-1]|uniref:hypothetical protein n=1 Tax=Halocella sp. SP3-1 TaxID=2382161 RepID=UPI000F75D4DB|nr:hypothetical protein [Halocella sp. SP3-1]AZO96129.1 hypothetical protein D7D81_16875 [Halocella sp. SP3-1]